MTRQLDSITYHIAGPKKISHSELTSRIDMSRDHHVPSVYPHVAPQSGPTCGIVALYTAALAQTKPGYHQKFPKPRKDRSGSSTSLRQIAKEQNLTIIGGIYSIFYLQQLGNAINLKTRAAQPYDDEYHETLTTSLKEEQLAIVACDLAEGQKFPGPSNGERTHWVVVIGYFFNRHDNELYYIICQYGTYFIWSAERLLKSNHELPDSNPRAGENHRYIKIDKDYFHFTEGLQKEYAFLRKGDKPEISFYLSRRTLSARKVITPCLARDGSLTDFRNSMLFIPKQKHLSMKRCSDEPEARADPEKKPRS